jgi:hypothetical protein
LAAGRAQARRFAVISRHGAEIGRSPAQSRARPILLCHWRLDPETGRPVCGWTIRTVSAAPGRRVLPSWTAAVDHADRDVASRRDDRADHAMLLAGARPASVMPARSRRGGA